MELHRTNPPWKPGCRRLVQDAKLNVDAVSKPSSFKEHQSRRMVNHE